jgi:hypothetical protein
VGNFQPRSETVLTWRIASVRELAALWRRGEGALSLSCFTDVNAADYRAPAALSP